MNCQDSNIIYLITCLHCKEQYIGETERKLSKRFAEHQGYVKGRDLTKATGNHFNKRGHDITDMKAFPIEKVLPEGDHLLRKRREKVSNPLWVNLLSRVQPFF